MIYNHYHGASSENGAFATKQNLVLIQATEKKTYLHSLGGNFKNTNTGEIKIKNGRVWFEDKEEKKELMRKTHEKPSRK